MKKIAVLGSTGAIGTNTLRVIQANPEKYQVVAFMRIDPEDPEPLTYEDALKEKEHLELLQPENVYRIEEIDND